MTKSYSSRITGPVLRSGVRQRGKRQGIAELLQVEQYQRPDRSPHAAVSRANSSYSPQTGLPPCAHSSAERQHGRQVLFKFRFLADGVSRLLAIEANWPEPLALNDCLLKTIRLN